MNFASLDSNALIALGFLIAILGISGGLFAYVLTRKNPR